MLGRKRGTSVTWIDALAGYIIAWRGIDAIASIFPILSRWLDSPYGWAYAYHAWDFAVPVAWYAGLRRRFPIGGIRANELRGWVAPGVATICVSLLALLVGYAFVGRNIHDAFDFSVQGWIFEATAPGLGEEFLFRGLVQTGLNASIPVAFFVRGVRINLGTILAALLFGVSHLGQNQPAFLTTSQLVFGPLVGLGLGIGYDRTRNLWGAVIVHNIANLINQGLASLL